MFRKKRVKKSSDQVLIPDKLTTKNQEKKEELLNIANKNSIAKEEIEQLNFEINASFNMCSAYKEQKRKNIQEIQEQEQKKSELIKELEGLNEKHESVNNEVKILEKEIKLKKYNLNKQKLKLQQNRDPESYRLIGIYLTATTVIGIILATLYYFCIHSKG